MPATVLVDDPVETVDYWRERARRAERRAERAEESSARTQVLLVETQARVEELSEQVAVLSRMLFGRSSEKARAGQASLDEHDEDVPAAAAPSGSGAGAPRRRRGQQPGSRGHGRRDYSHLDTREIIHDVPADQRYCSCCGVEFESLGSEASEQIDWAVTVTRIVHRRLRYRRRCDCPGPRTVTAPPAANPIPKGRLTPGFLARLLYDKYTLGLPVQRIVRSLAAEGLDMAEGTLCGALKAVADLLVPVEAAIIARNALACHAHADETTWRVYERPEGKEGFRWWLWVFLADDTVVFTMDPTRSATVLDRHFGIDRADGKLPDDRHLVLSTDFYTAYQSLARVDGVDPLWCWSHLRRYFVRAGDAHVQLRPWRDMWVARIADLYAAHRAMAAAQVASPAYAKASEDFEQALAVIDTARHQDAAVHSLHPAARKVLATLDHEWDGLVRHRDFPDIDLDNNAAERALRNPVIGRKNYYGSHAQWSAYLAARVWTVTATAERNGLEPLAYLIDYLQACANAGGKAPEGAALDRFLPWIPAPDEPTGSRDHDPPQVTTLNPAASSIP
jgi:transposase